MSSNSKKSIFSYFQKVEQAKAQESAVIECVLSLSKNENEVPVTSDPGLKLNNVVQKKTVHPFFRSKKDIPTVGISSAFDITGETKISNEVDLVDEHNLPETILMSDVVKMSASISATTESKAIESEANSASVPRSINHDELPVESTSPGDIMKRKTARRKPQLGCDVSIIATPILQSGRQLRPRVSAKSIIEAEESWSDNSKSSQVDKVLVGKKRSARKAVASKTGPSKKASISTGDDDDDVQFVPAVGSKKASEFFLDKVARAKKRADEVHARFQEDLMRSKETEKAFFAGRGERSANPFFAAASAPASDKLDSCLTQNTSTIVAEIAPTFPSTQHVLQHYSSNVTDAPGDSSLKARTFDLECPVGALSDWRGILPEKPPSENMLADYSSLDFYLPTASVAWMTSVAAGGSRTSNAVTAKESHGAAESPQSAALTELRDWMRSCLHMHSDKHSKRADDRSQSRREGNASSRKRFLEVSDDDIEEFQSEAEETQANVLVLRGCSGAGKTALVYECAESLGVRVMEIGTDSARGGATVKRLVAEATQSHGISVAAPGQLGRAPPAAESVPAGELCVILFDEADVLFPEDSGFSSAVLSIARSTRRPIVLTCESRLPFLSSLRPLCKEVELRRPDIASCVRYLRSSSTGEVSEVDCELLSALCKQDTRRAQAELQLLIPPRTSTCNRSERQPYIVWLCQQFSLDFAVLDALGSVGSPPMQQCASLKLCCDLLLPEVFAATSAPREGGGWVVTVQGRHFLQRKGSSGAPVEVVLGGEAARHIWPEPFPALVVSDSELKFTLSDRESGERSYGAPLVVVVGCFASSRTSHSYCWLPLRPLSEGKVPRGRNVGAPAKRAGKRPTKVNPSEELPESEDDFEPDTDEEKWTAERRKQLASGGAEVAGRKRSHRIIEDDDDAGSPLQRGGGTEGTDSAVIDSVLLFDGQVGQRSSPQEAVVDQRPPLDPAPLSVLSAELSLSALDAAEAGRSGKTLPRAVPNETVADSTSLEALCHILDLLSDASLLDTMAAWHTSAELSGSLAVRDESEGESPSEGVEGDGLNDLETFARPQPWWISRLPVTNFIRNVCADYAVSSSLSPAPAVSSVTPEETVVVESSEDSVDEAELFEQPQVSPSVLGRSTPRHKSVDLCVSNETRQQLGGFLISRLQSVSWTESAGKVLRRGFNELVCAVPSATLVSCRLDLMPYLAVLAIAEDLAESASSDASGFGRGCRRNFSRAGRTSASGPLKRIGVTAEDRADIRRLGLVFRTMNESGFEIY